MGVRKKYHTDNEKSFKSNQQQRPDEEFFDANPYGAIVKPGRILGVRNKDESWYARHAKEERKSEYYHDPLLAKRPDFTNKREMENLKRDLNEKERIRSYFFDSELVNHVNTVMNRNGMKPMNEHKVRQSMENASYRVPEPNMENYDKLPFDDAKSIYKKYCKKYLSDMLQLVRVRKKKRLKRFGKTIIENTAMERRLGEIDSLIESRVSELRTRYEKYIPMLWESLSKRAEFKKYMQDVQKQYEVWENQNRVQNEAALKNVRKYLQIPVTVKDRNEPFQSILTKLDAEEDLEKLVEEGYNRDELERLRDEIEGRSIGKLLKLLEGEIEDKEKDIDLDLDLYREPYPQLGEDKLRALLHWSKGAKDENTEKWRNQLIRRIKQLANGRRSSALSSTNSNTLLRPNEVFKEVALAQENEEKILEDIRREEIEEQIEEQVKRSEQQREEEGSLLAEQEEEIVEGDHEHLKQPGSLTYFEEGSKGTEGSELPRGEGATIKQNRKKAKFLWNDDFEDDQTQKSECFDEDDDETRYSVTETDTENQESSRGNEGFLMETVTKNEEKENIQVVGGSEKTVEQTENDSLHQVHSKLNGERNLDEEAGESGISAHFANARNRIAEFFGATQRHSIKDDTEESKENPRTETSASQLLAGTKAVLSAATTGAYNMLFNRNKNLKDEKYDIETTKEENARTSPFVRNTVKSSSTVSPGKLLVIPKLFELGILGKIARNSLEILRSWGDRFDWDSYLEKMQYLRVEDLKNDDKLDERFGNDKIYIQAIVKVCEKHMVRKETLSREEKMILGTHNGKEMIDIYQFDLELDELKQNSSTGEFHGFEEDLDSKNELNQNVTETRAKSTGNSEFAKYKEKKEEVGMYRMQSEQEREKDERRKRSVQLEKTEDANALDNIVKGRLSLTTSEGAALLNSLSTGKEIKENENLHRNLETSPENAKSKTLTYMESELTRPRNRGERALDNQHAHGGVRRGVLVAPRCFELGILSKIASEARELLRNETWRNKIDFVKHLKDLNYLRLKSLEDDHICQERFGEETEIVKEFIRLYRKSKNQKEMLSMSEKVALKTHNGKDIQNILSFEEELEEFLN